MSEVIPRIVGLQVGLPQEIRDDEGAGRHAQPWVTGLYKQPVVGPVTLSRTNLEGDGQADLKHHGGPDKAVCVYPSAHYRYWEERLGHELPPAAFGENFTVSGLDESTLCLGDVFDVGSARVQVSQPRSPCWKIAHRWHKSLALWVQETGFTGWYLRVLQEGIVQAGDEFRLQARPHPTWTLTRLNKVRYKQVDDTALIARLADAELLSESWREHFARRVAGAATRPEEERLGGKS